MFKHKTCQNIYIMFKVHCILSTIYFMCIFALYKCDFARIVLIKLLYLQKIEDAKRSNTHC